jgi:hypothetical protein
MRKNLVGKMGDMVVLSRGRETIVLKAFEGEDLGRGGEGGREDSIIEETRK